MIAAVIHFVASCRFIQELMRLMVSPVMWSIDDTRVEGTLHGRVR